MDNSSSMNKFIARAKTTDKVMTGVLYTVGGLFLLLLFVLAGYIISKGFIDFYPELLQFNRNGIGNQFFNTIYLVFLSLVISVPLGIAAGIYMAEYARKGRLTSFLRVCIESLSSLPSIVVGLFGYLVFILMTGARWNLMAGAMAVSILSLPLITTTTEDAILALPGGYKEGSMALGASHWRTIYKVLLPACMPRIITGMILVAGRGFGEAAALLYTAGQSTNINWSNWNITSPLCPLNPFRPGETLSLHIWAMRTEGSLNPHSAAIANFSAAVLVIMVLSFSLLARLLSRRINKKTMDAK
jgi:phosphate transport system permease protein